MYYQREKLNSSDNIVTKSLDSGKKRKKSNFELYFIF